MLRMLHLKFTAACFLALLTAFSLFTICSTQTLADPPQGPTTANPAGDPPPDPNAAGAGLPAVALFLCGAACLAALQQRRSSNSKARV